MLRLFFARRVVLILALFAPFAARAAAATYADLLAAADALVAEQSWEQAKLRYTEALAAAPDAAARAQCELLIEDASWRSEATTPIRWRDGDRWEHRHLAAFDRLEAPYRDAPAPRPRDDFWVDLLTRRIQFERFANLSDAVNQHFTAVADFLGAQSPSPAAARRFVDFLQRILDPSADRRRPFAAADQFPRLRAYLTDAARIAASPDDRAWCLWQLARPLDPFSASTVTDDPAALARELAARWSTALAASASTRWAPQIRAEAFLWRVLSRYSPDLPTNAPADIPALLAELKSLRASLAQAPSPDLSQKLDSLEHELSEPRLDLAIDQLVAPEAPVRFSYGTSGLSRLVLALDRTSPAGWFSLGDARFNNGTANPRTHRPDDRTSVREWTIALPDPARLTWSAALTDAVPHLPPGLYALTITGEKPDGSAPLIAQRKFVVSSLRGLGILAVNATGRLFIYHADGKPATGLATELFVSGAKSPRVPSATTDELGSLPLPPSDENAREFVALVASEPVCFANAAMWHGSDRQLYFDVFTDRPLFRPGETAHWKLIARERRGGRFTIPQDLSDLKFQIKSRHQLLVPPNPFVLSATGSAAGEIQIPADARPDDVVLQIIPTVTTSARSNQFVDLFRIDNFIPPAATATVAFTGDARSFRPGRTITARVTAAYFSGGPLVGTPVLFRFEASTPPDVNGESFDKWSASLHQNPNSAATDSRGEAETTLTLPEFFPDGVSLGVTAIVSPEGVPALDAEAKVVINASGLTLDPLGWTAPRLAAPQEKISFAAIVRDGRGAPVLLDARAQLIELRWSEVWIDAQGTVIPPEEITAALVQNGFRRPPRDGAKLVHAGYTETVADDTDVRTADDGRLTIAFTIPRAGLFRVRVRVLPTADEIRPFASLDYSRHHLFDEARYDRNQDRAADNRLDCLSLVAVDNRTDTLALNPENAALITPAELLPGQPLRLLALVPVGISQAWLSLGGEKAIAVEPIALRGRLALHTFSNPISALGTLRAELIYRTSPGTPNRSAYATIPVSRAANRLHLTIAPAAVSSRPGQSSNLVVNVVDSTGHPAVSAELAVRVADEAVVSLLSDDETDTQSRFLNLSETTSNREVWSVDETYELRAPIDPRSGAIRNPSGEVLDGDGELITLSPFAVESRRGSYGYAASATLAGSRLARPDPSQTMLGAPGEVAKAPALSDTPIILRSHFSSTAFWSPSVITDAKGEARVTFTYPDNLTRWRLGAYALGADGNTFGTATAFTQTSLPFQARLQLPRFLIAGDTASPSVALVNRTDADLRATATLALSGPVAAEKNPSLTHADLLVPKQAEAHTAWPISATAPGTAELKLTARADTESDAMSLPLPILEDGIQQHTAAFARLAPDAARTDFTLELPATLDPARTTVSLQLSPSYATTLLDALPYLVDYPYGCVEQTMSRFLPAVVVRKTLTDLGLDADAVERRILARESAADKTRREQIAGFAHLDDVVAQSLSRLEEAQTWQGFGWWPGAQSPDLWMTAYVSWGLSLAADADIEIPDHLRESTTLALANLVQQNDPPDDRLAFAWAALARAPAADLSRVARDLPPHFAKSFAARVHLSASGRACLALAAKTFGTPDQLATLLRNLDNGVERSTAAGLGDTAHWGAAHDYWRAMDSAVESTALTLLALLELDSKNPLIEPAAHWLALNRRSAHWSSTRDTAFAVLALNQFLRAHGQLDATADLELLANGHSLQRFSFSRATLLDSTNTTSVPASALRGGKNTFTLRRVSGAAPILATATSSSWARGDDVKPLGHLVEVARVFDRQKTEPTLLGTLRLSTEPLDSHHAALAGEEVTARLTLTVPNELEYVMIAVPKPAGCEPLNSLSGWDARLVRLAVSQPPVGRALRPPDASPATTTDTGDSSDAGRPLYREEHDDRSVFFLDHLEAGTWELRFRLRAITPGDFRALPATAEAMYAPEITANSDARRVRIEPAR